MENQDPMITSLILAVKYSKKNDETNENGKLIFSLIIPLLWWNLK
jgi:hypothetical protein